MAGPVWGQGCPSGKIIYWYSQATIVSSPGVDGMSAPTAGLHRRHIPNAGRARGDKMAAMKPRTGDGPLEVTKEGRGIVMRVPLEGGGRLVVEMTPDEATALGEALKTAVG
jgi:hypothetical protein